MFLNDLNKCLLYTFNTETDLLSLIALLHGICHGFSRLSCVLIMQRYFDFYTFVAFSEKKELASIQWCWMAFNSVGVLSGIVWCSMALTGGKWHCLSKSEPQADGRQFWH